MSGCDEFNKLCDEEIYHETQFNDSWDNIDEHTREQMSQEETEKYYADPEGERRFDEENTRKKCIHLLQCTDKGCIKIKETWQSHERLGKELKKYGDSRTGETPKADNTADTGRC